MEWGQYVVQWLHVLLGIMWFGTVLYNAVILVPAVSALPLGRQREIGRVLAPHAVKVIRPVAAAVIVLGVLRGTVFGPIKSIDALATPYGITWSIALVLTLAAYAWGERLVGPALERMNGLPESEALRPDGQPTSRLAAAVDDVKRKLVLELVLFFAIFSAMILMRFGL